MGSTKGSRTRGAESTAPTGQGESQHLHVTWEATLLGFCPGKGGHRTCSQEKLPSIWRCTQHPCPPGSQYPWGCWQHPEPLETLLVLPLPILTPQVQAQGGGQNIQTLKKSSTAVSDAQAGSAETTWGVSKIASSFPIIGKFQLKQMNGNKCIFISVNLEPEVGISLRHEGG